jgi:V/A-type H+-transporting ATPase subunit D
LTRARVLGAGDEIRALIERGPSPAVVNANWQTSMGTTYPGAVDCSPGAPVAFSCTAAIRPAIDAFRNALTAGATHAATTTALRRLDTELANTRRRRRAIGERLVPRLERVLHELDLQLDEQDREEAIRVQIANRTHETSPR